MAQGWAESTREITNYWMIVNQFQPDIKRSIRQLGRINKKYLKNVFNVQSNMYQ